MKTTKFFLLLAFVAVGVSSQGENGNSANSPGEARKGYSLKGVKLQNKQETELAADLHERALHELRKPLNLAADKTVKEDVESRLAKDDLNDITDAQAARIASIVDDAIKLLTKYGKVGEELSVAVNDVAKDGIYLAANKAGSKGAVRAVDQKAGPRIGGQQQYDTKAANPRTLQPIVTLLSQLKAIIEKFQSLLSNFGLELRNDFKASKKSVNQ